MKHKKRKRGCLIRLLSWMLFFAFLFGCFRFAEKRLFPMPSRETVLLGGAETDVPPALLYALIKAESNFNPEARSQKGAMGLTQLMEETAAWCSEKSGLPLTDILNPEENIALGAYYLGYLLSMYDGKIPLAVAAYNAGQGRVNRWLSDPSYSEDGISLSEIPFPETDRYVKKVTLYRKIYEKRLK